MSDDSDLQPEYPRLNIELGIYELKLGRITLESNDDHVFSLRFNELLNLDLTLIPQGIKFIILDETMGESHYLVNIKLILKRVDDRKYEIKVEESGERNDWDNKPGFDEYFSTRYSMLLERQHTHFDVMVEPPHNFVEYYLQEYTLFTANLDAHNIFGILKTLIRSIHRTSNKFNSLTN